MSNSPVRPRASLWRTAAEGLQWLTFSLSSSIGVPLVIGAALGLAAGDRVLLLQNTLLMVGVSTLVQLRAGYRMAVTMVPALLWATVMLSLIRFAGPGAAGLTGTVAAATLITDVQGGYLVSALVLALLAVAGVARLLVRLFTPVTISIYLLMLVIQAAGPFMADALAVGVRGPGPDLTATASSLLLFLLFLALSSPRSRPVLRALALPLAVLAGGAALWLLDGDQGAGLPAGLPWLQAPLLPWGAPTFNPAVIAAMVPSVVPALASISSAVMAGSQAYGLPLTPALLRRAVLGTGLGTAMAAAGGVVGPVLQSEAVGFAVATGMRGTRSLAAGMGLVTLIGVSPVLAGVLAGIPTSLLAAALLAAFSPLAGVAVRTLLSGPLTQRELTIFGLSLLFGTGMAFLPAAALTAMPDTLRYLLSNGMVVGVAVAMLLEHVVFRRAWPDPGQPDRAILEAVDKEPGSAGQEGI